MLHLRYDEIIVARERHPNVRVNDDIPDLQMLVLRVHCYYLREPVEEIPN
jgi:hypothetical protein